jgi:hypothetical protein
MGYSCDVRIVPRRPIYLFPAARLALLIHLRRRHAVDVFQLVWKNCTQMPTCTTLYFTYIECLAARQPDV